MEHTYMYVDYVNLNEMAQITSGRQLEKLDKYGNRIHANDIGFENESDLSAELQMEGG